MGTILSFPQERREPAEDFSFVSDGETLDFDGEEAEIQLARTGTEQDWDNQEVADLYRVKHLLDQAGIASETDRGVSDEGDPWFVFMRADSEVFIHFCRIDGTYFLDSPNLHSALKGHDARALIADYTSKVMDRADSEHDPRTVVPLRTGGNRVSLHPSVMLAALIWSLLIGAEDAVSLPVLGASGTQEPMDAGTPRLASNDVMRDVAQRSGPAEDDTTVAPATPQAEILHSRDASGGFNGYATGLSAIAIGIGVLADHGLDLFDDTSLEQIFQYLAGLEGLTNPSAGETTSSKPFSAAEIEALDVLIKITQIPVEGTTAPNSPREANGLMASIEQAVTASVDSAEHLHTQATTALDNLPASNALGWGSYKTTSSPVSDDTSDIWATAMLTSVSPTPDQTPVTQAATASYGSNFALSEIKVGESLLLASFKVTETLLDKFDVADVLSSGALDTVPDPYVSEEDLDAGLPFEISRAIDRMGSSDARNIIQSLIAQQADLEIADSGSWLWIVEADAQYAPLDQTVSKVFNTEDGARIMITGLQTTFADADIGIG